MEFQRMESYQVRGLTSLRAFAFFARFAVSISEQYINRKGHSAAEPQQRTGPSSGGAECL
jgi:hypothetical protein